MRQRVHLPRALFLAATICSICGLLDGALFQPSNALRLLQADLRSRLAALCPVCEAACRTNVSWGMTESSVPDVVDHAGDQQLPGPDFLLIGTQKGGTSDLYVRMQEEGVGIDAVTCSFVSVCLRVCVSACLRLQGACQVSLNMSTDAVSDLASTAPWLL